MSISVHGTNGVTFNDGSLQKTSAQTGFRNRIINGDMRIDQRNAGASVTIQASVFTYVVDRFCALATAASKFSLRQNAGGITPASGFTQYLGATSLSAYSIVASDVFTCLQFIEGLNCQDLAWGTAGAKTVTLSFQVYSSLTGTFGGAIRNASATRSYPFSYSIPTSNTWTTISITIAGDTSGTWATNNGIGIACSFSLGAGSTFSGTAGAWAAGDIYSTTGAVSVVGTNGATFYITGVQLEAGSTATEFERRPYGTELALCQRYYVRYAETGVRLYGGRTESTTFAIPAWSLPVEMRASPTVAGGTLSGITLNDGSANIAAGSLSSQFCTSKLFAIGITVASGLTTFRSLFTSFAVGSYLDASAEL
jgi:hypothetical protein